MGLIGAGKIHHRYFHRLLVAFETAQKNNQNLCRTGADLFRIAVFHFFDEMRDSGFHVLP